MTQSIFEREQRLGPEGVGGWLILPVIGLFLTPLLFALAFVGFLEAPAGSGPRSALLWAAIAASGAIIPYAIYTIWLFLQRRKTFPRFMIGLYATAFAITVLNYLVTKEASMEPVTSDITRGGGAFVIWGWYFLRSKRVENTFVN